MPMLYRWTTQPTRVQGGAPRKKLELQKSLTSVRNTLFAPTVNFNDFAFVLGITVFEKVGPKSQQGWPKPEQVG